MVVPAHMVITVQAHLMARGGNAGQNLPGRGPDERRRQEGPITHGLEPIKGRSPGAPHLLQKTRLPKNPKNGAAGIVRPQSHKKTGLDPLGLQYLQQSRHPLPQTLQGVHIHLQSQPRRQTASMLMGVLGEGARGQWAPAPSPKPPPPTPYGFWAGEVGAMAPPYPAPIKGAGRGV